MVTIIAKAKGTSVSTTANKMEVLVDSGADLKSIPDDAAPGSIAYTADFSGMWQKANNGVWVEIGGGD